VLQLSERTFLICFDELVKRPLRSMMQATKEDFKPRKTLCNGLIWVVLHVGVLFFHCNMHVVARLVLRVFRVGGATLK